MFTNLLTASQVLHVYAFAGATKEKLPKKNQTTVLVSPAGDVQFEITKTVIPAVYGGKLFKVVHRPL